MKLTDGSVEEGVIFNQPVLADGRLYYYMLQRDAGNSNHMSFHLDVFDASSGRMLWRYQPASSINDMLVSNNTVYLSSEKFDANNPKYPPAENDLIALNSADGSQKWSEKTSAGLVPSAGSLNKDNEMVIENGIIYQLLYSAACGDKGGSCLFAYRADTGVLLWHSQNLVPAASAQSAEMLFTGSLIAAGNALYINSIDGLLALDAGNGRLLWQQSEGSLLSSKPPNNRLLSLPFAGKGNNPFVVVGDMIFRMEITAQGNYITRLNARNGNVIARQHVENFFIFLFSETVSDTKQYTSTEPYYTGFFMLEGLMSDTTTYVFPSVGHLDALDNRTGKRLWSLHLMGGGAAVLALAQ
jgi:outer membrane protein assembly factor BamB